MLLLFAVINSPTSYNLAIIITIAYFWENHKFKGFYFPAMALAYKKELTVSFKPISEK